LVNTVGCVGFTAKGIARLIQVRLPQIIMLPSWELLRGTNESIACFEPNMFALLGIGLRMRNGSHSRLGVGAILRA